MSWVEPVLGPGTGAALALALGLPLAVRALVHRGFRIPCRPEVGTPADAGLPYRSPPSSRNGAAVCSRGTSCRREAVRLPIWW
ncbi:hypothetical protein F1643_05865 [Azospirillum sp. INR13]|uniref:hypothetical protein n=1 Tax=Azospirillum sp. INR13 TaxID=2596919 RepID=UPI0018922154|nr:hypothetical protein [Azospirillum sp. INR13]MBF5094083.1 hypothetical protein [Azospirillum sp. INR13]